MAPDYKRNSPNANMGAMGQTPGYGGGSQSGSDFDFGTPQSIDAMMQGGDLSTYRSAPAMIPGYSSAFDPSMTLHGSVQNGHTHRGSISSMPDGQSPNLGQHRLSISSTGPYMGQERYGGSDDMSPDGNRGLSGDNLPGNNSNDSINSQPAAEDAKGDMYTASEHIPAWSELKTKAGKERKRLPLACIACRRKKIRCSGEKPACKHCLRSRIPCVYKVTARKAAPRTDYMAMLDKRLKRMEERVIKVIPKEEQGILTSTGRAVVKPPLPPPPPKSAGSSKKRGAEAAFAEELDQWANADTASAAVKEEVQPGVEGEAVKSGDSEDQSLLQDGADKLPSKEIQEHLSETFFDFVYGQSYPLLHKPSFMRRLAQGQVPPVLMLAVCAISARFSTHPEVKTEPAFLRGESWASAARDIALRRYDTPNITILIVYLILGLHEFGTCQGGRSWMFGGMAQRMAYALQLHKDLDSDPRGQRAEDTVELTFTDREIRRRTMWSCFLMDRFNSSGTERPIFVGEQYIRAQLPIKEEYFQMEIGGPTEDLDGDVPNPVEANTGQMADAKENMGVSAYHIRLVAIWGKLVNYLNLGGKDRDPKPMWAKDSSFYNLKHAAHEWKANLPESLHYSAENLQNHASENIGNQFIFMHIAYHQIILFMNRFALPMPGCRPTYPKDIPPDFVSEAANAAHEAANQISALINEAMDHNVVAPFAGYCAFFSSTVHIYGAFSKKPALEASSKQNLAWNVRYLTKMKKYWGMFHFMTENLRDLYRRHADAARGNKAGSKEADQNIFQYGDWFDRYPHGVSGTDYEEPSAGNKKELGADAALGQKSDLQTVEEFFSKMVPPSLAAQNQPSSQRKMAKKKHSKSEGRQTRKQQQQQNPQTQSQPSDETLAFQNNVPGLQQPLPPGYAQPLNPLASTSPSQFMMSPLDRQMVLNPYAGMDGTSPIDPNLDHSNLMADPGVQNMMDAVDFNALGNHSNNATGLWADNSNGWFMPFNMEPPAIEDDGNLFGGHFEWSNFNGLDDLNLGLQPTGLTPNPDLDVDLGPEQIGSDGLGRGMDGYDRR